MGKFDALLEDENDIFGGTPVSKYWDISNQTIDELVKDEFDILVGRLVAMEALLSETHDYETLDRTISSYILQNHDKMDELKKSAYMDLAAKLIFRAGD